jgi:hypothetical protein
MGVQSKNQPEILRSSNKKIIKINTFSNLQQSALLLFLSENSSFLLNRHGSSTIIILRPKELKHDSSTIILTLSLTRPDEAWWYRGRINHNPLTKISFSCGPITINQSFIDWPKTFNDFWQWSVCILLFLSYVEIVEFWLLQSCHIVSQIVQNKIIRCNGGITFRAAINIRPCWSIPAWVNNRWSR